MNQTRLVYFFGFLIILLIYCLYKSEEEIKTLKKIFGSSMYFLKIDDVSKTLNKQIKGNEQILNDKTLL